MFEPIGSLINAIKNAGPVLYAAALAATSFLLFLPDDTITQMGLNEFRLTHRSELGATLLISASLLIVHALFAVGRSMRSGWKKWQFQRNARAMLEELTEEEKEFLRPYILAGENTQHASIYDGIANGLEARRIVYRASQMSVAGTPGLLFPWNLQPYARTMLSEEPYLLDAELKRPATLAGPLHSQPRPLLERREALHQGAAGVATWPSAQMCH
jgi:hypothetical protein